ncbi:MAG TPA: hypothetical protein VFV38_07975 [Ktedonobacteraceae bacterium]|nr:hypothetical protein [Ktedonobacteraceae bacterium]
MKIKLPKHITGVKFPRICTIEMNDFDIDLFLPSLFFTILAQGRGKARQVNDPKAISLFIDILAQHPILEGFNDTEGRKVLERFVRTTLITTGGVGRSRIDEQITSVVPFTILAHKTGFPTKGRQRNTDTFIYQVLRERMGAEDALRDFVKTVFGNGVIIGNIPELGGKYDGETNVDTLTRLSIAFLDGFQNTRPGISREKNVPSPCPALAKEFATDLLRYLFEYHKTMPTQAFTHHLLILINFELFNYTLKLVHSVNELVQTPEHLPTAMRESFETSPPQLYVDFTASSSEYSQEMARACVRRDVETYQQFLESNLLLRQLDLYVEKLKRNARSKLLIERVLPPTNSGAEYLQGLLQLRKDPVISRDIAASARNDEDEIRRLNTNEGEEEDPEALSWFDDIVDTAEDDVERVVSLLVEAQRGEAIQHFIRWYWGVGGMKKPQGILRGVVTNRKSWRYAPTNDVLAVLVQLAAVRLGKPTNPEQGESIQSFRLQEFLLFLEERFGILVDRPPVPFEGAEYTAAARENLRAMLRRLRQMGIFRDLSDDFTVQRLHPPYAGKEMTGVRR